MARHPRWVRDFASERDLDDVAAAVARAEQRTAAEIRVHLDHRCAGDPLTRAVAVFERLAMHRTEHRAGVLVYVAVEDHKLAVIGDAGIHERVGQPYWDALVARVLAHLREGRPREGLVLAVEEVGAALAAHFPRRRDDRNELPDRVSLE
ncbi:MAG TPA: TPM domain-containing protein [Methylomirabilota bacterium]|nr:TPM domain-containing protein [Methylomirabilota bacterium]